MVYKKYVPWLLENPGDSYLRPGLSIYQNEEGSHPFVLMFEWESLGKDYRRGCNNTKLLESLIQAKTLRDFHITEYKAGIKEGTFQSWEFIGTGDITVTNYKTVLRV